MPLGGFLEHIFTVWSSRFLKNISKTVTGKRNKEINTCGFDSVLPDTVLDACFISLFHQNNLVM